MGFTKQYGVDFLAAVFAAGEDVPYPIYADIQVPDNAASAVEVFREATVALDDIKTLGRTIIGELESSNVIAIVA